MKFFVILLFLFIAFNANVLFAQKFSLEELFLFQKMELGQVNDTLLARKWKFFKSDGQTETKYGESIWHFGKLEKYKIKAEGWFYFLAADSLPNRIIYQFQKPEQFDAFKLQLDKPIFREIGSEMYEANMTKMCCKTRYKLVLTDIMMPVMDGYEAAQAINEL